MFATLTTLADYTYTYTTTSGASSSPSGGFLAGYFVFIGIFTVIMIVSMWKVFTKAKQPGWASLVPIYDTLVLLKIVGRPWYWLLLMMIPIVNIVLAVIVYNDLSKSFGKGVGMTLLLLFLPFIGLPMLAFGSAQYQGPAALNGGGATPAAPVAPVTGADGPQPTAV
ncbi:MAG TPA: DUF5684 domain-containing protein [Patescibacteria group bacterium]|nr:DUF5684 domain-containing protein [Patescibacteria group bacterium]